MMTGVNTVHVPYRGAAPALAEAMWPVRSLITWTRFGGGLYRSIHSCLLKVKIAVRKTTSPSARSVLSRLFSFYLKG
jgi:hypothetical protein